MGRFHILLASAGPYTGPMDIRTFLRRVALGAVALCATGPLFAAHPLPPVPGEVIVKFKAEAASVRQHALSARAETATVRAALAGRATALGQRVGRGLEAGDAVGANTQVVRAKGMSSAALVALLKADPEVEFVEPVQRVRRHTAPNDPYYLAGPAVSGSTGGPVVGQWYLRTPTANAATSTTDLVSSIGIEAAWNRTLGAATVVVAVLDTGVRKEHPDLAGRLLAGYDFVSDTEVANDGDGRDGDPSDPGDFTTAAENSNPSGTFYQCDPRGLGLATATPSSWHGTTTASLVGAATNDGIGMAGTAPGVKVLPVRVLGKCFGSSPDILAAMRWAAGIHVDGVPDNPNPAKVINMSLGGGTCSAAYQQAVNEVLAAGAVIVASAGNSEGEPMEAPGSCTGVIGVTALRNVGTKVGFSSLGTASTLPTIGAPGGNCVNLSGACLYPILAATNLGSTVPTTSGYSDSFNYTLGTSFSSPLVAGVAALIVSVNSSATPAQVKNYITSTARSFPTTGGTSGISACRAAVANVVQDECYCNSFCGAGMLDAGAAVAAAAGSTVTPPAAAITVSPASPVAGQTVTLSSSSTAGSFVITGYLWRLVSGGGAVPSVANGSTLGSGSSVTLSPTATGTVQVSLQVTDAGGNTNQTTSSFTVGTAAGPTSSFTVTPAAPTAGSAFTLTSTATAGSLAIAGQQWTLVDGGGVVSGLANGASLGTGSTATVTASAAGTVVVSLRVTDSAGNSGTSQQSVAVAAAPAGGGSGGGGGGGGATSPYWLAGLALAVLALFRTRPNKA